MKQIPKHPNYTISKDGRVWSHRRKYVRGKWLKPSIQRGYLKVTLDGCVRPVHCLVLETYVGPCPKNMQCRHLDGVRYNNKIENLCWGTTSENAQDAMKHGTHSCLQKYNMKTKLNETEKEMVYQAFHSGLYKTQELADAYCVSSTTIRKVAHEYESGMK